jgi:hypothetical protein
LVTYVDRIVPGFAADRSGRFAVGDTVLAIDGVAVQSYGLDAIKNLTIGPAGSAVTIEYARGGLRRSETLIRRMPDYTDNSNADAANVLVASRSGRPSGSNYASASYSSEPGYGAPGYGPEPGYGGYGGGYNSDKYAAPRPLQGYEGSY